VWERLEQLRDKGTTILITTHDMEEADTLCDELAILHQGRLAVVGKPDALKAQVGEQASLDDVFVHFSGVGLEQDGNYRGTRDSRDAIQRLG
jgi:ABC-2 type transport system ATP-binding protein